MKLQSNESKIANFYSQFPFPNIPLDKQSDIYQTLIYKLITGLAQKHFDKYESKEIKILDAGCGTGELTLGLAREGRSILGIDINKKSIEIAQKRIKKFHKKDIVFKHFDFVQKDLPKNHFDFIFSIGVLHHTSNPEQNFKRLIKSLRKGGYITIGIYNPYGSFKVRIKRAILNLLAGNNYEKKIEIYRRIFYRRELTVQEKVAVADAFANPYRRYYDFNQLLKWFKENNIEYLDSTPPIELSKNILLLKNFAYNIFFRRKFDLMSSWQEVASSDDKFGKWEISKVAALLTQFIWIPFGRGELINLIGRKIK